MPSEVLIKGRDAAFFAERLAQALPDLRFHAARDPAEALAKCANADILIIRTDEIFAELVDRDAEAAADPGADHRHRSHPGAAEPAASTSLLAAARGFHGPQMSELAFIFMLHFARDFRDLFATQAAHRWNRVEQSLLVDRTAVIVGVGSIAEDLAQKLQGVRHACRRRERRPQRGALLRRDPAARASSTRRRRRRTS